MSALSSKLPRIRPPGSANSSLWGGHTSHSAPASGQQTPISRSDGPASASGSWYDGALAASASEAGDNSGVNRGENIRVVVR